MRNVIERLQLTASPTTPCASWRWNVNTQNHVVSAPTAATADSDSDSGSSRGAVAGSTEPHHPMLRVSRQTLAALARHSREKRPEQVSQRRVGSFVVWDRRGVDVSLSFLAMPHMAFFLENAERDSGRVICRVAGEIVGDFGYGGFSEAINGIHDLPFSSAELGLEELGHIGSPR